jgi:hypothetical protein
VSLTTKLHCCIACVPPTPCLSQNPRFVTYNIHNKRSSMCCVSTGKARPGRAPKTVYWTLFYSVCLRHGPSLRNIVPIGIHILKAAYYTGQTWVGACTSRPTTFLRYMMYFFCIPAVLRQKLPISPSVLRFQSSKFCSGSAMKKTLKLKEHFPD